jgi:hypothetical protein
MPALSSSVPFVIANTKDTNDQFIETPIDFNSAGNNIIVPGVPGMGIYVFKIWFVVGGTTNVQFFDDVAELTGAVPLVTNEALVFTFDTRPWFSTSVGGTFIINSSTSTQVGGRVYYLQQ